eukprot:10339072-Alexandrium_andersonii.AAC.1
MGGRTRPSPQAVHALKAALAPTQHCCDTSVTKDPTTCHRIRFSCGPHAISQHRALRVAAS